METIMEIVWKKGQEIKYGVVFEYFYMSWKKRLDKF